VGKSLPFESNAWITAAGRAWEERCFRLTTIPERIRSIIFGQSTVE
jgi:hypothetical protein